MNAGFQSRVPESNAGEAKRGYLDAVPIPPSHVHPFATDGDPETSAENMRT